MLKLEPKLAVTDTKLEVEAMFNRLLLSGLLLAGTMVGIGLSGATKAEAAKSNQVRVRTNQQLKPGVTVVATGKNKLFNKAGTLRGAKVIASKDRLSAMTNSRSSQSYFRAYRVATLSNGLIYYKVVSFDGQYRGWLYGGRSMLTMTNGLKATGTVTEAEMPNVKQSYRYQAGQVVWQHPQWSVYKNQQVVSDTSQSLTHELRVTQAVRLNREGTLWYYVKDLTKPNLSGWVRASSVQMVADV